MSNRNALYVVEKLYVEVNKEVQNKIRHSEVDEHLIKKRNLIKSIRNFRDDLSYIKRQDSKDRIKYYMRNNFDIIHTSRAFGKETTNSIRTSVWNASKKFTHCIGKNTLSLIKENKIEQAEKEFLINTGKINVDTVILKGFTELIPENVVDRTIFIKDCEKEIKVLKNISINVIKNVLTRIDMDKMALLMYILKEQDSFYQEHRNLIYSFLEGEIDNIELLMLELQEIEL